MTAWIVFLVAAFLFIYIVIFSMWYSWYIAKRPNPWQKMLVEFHETLCHTVGKSPEIRDAWLRAELIREEAAETVKAINEKDLVESIDGLCDLIYVAVGAAVAFGVDLDPFFREVHRTNMLKAGGPVRADGKRMKPVGWQPPRIKEILEEQIAEAKEAKV